MSPRLTGKASVTSPVAGFSHCSQVNLTHQALRGLTHLPGPMRRQKVPLRSPGRPRRLRGEGSGQGSCSSLPSRGQCTSRALGPAVPCTPAHRRCAWSLTISTKVTRCFSTRPGEIKACALSSTHSMSKDRTDMTPLSTPLPAGEPGALSLSLGRPASLCGAGVELAESKVLDSSDCGGPSGPRTTPRGRLRRGNDLPRGSGKPPYRGTRGRWLWCSSQSQLGEAAVPP